MAAAELKVFILRMGHSEGLGNVRAFIKATSAETVCTKLDLMEETVRFSGIFYLWSDFQGYFISLCTNIKPGKVLTLYPYLWVGVSAPVDLNKDGCYSGHAAAEVGGNSERFVVSVQESRKERKFSDNHAC